MEYPQDVKEAVVRSALAQEMTQDAIAALSACLRPGSATRSARPLTVVGPGVASAGGQGALATGTADQRGSALCPLTPS